MALRAHLPPLAVPWEPPPRSYSEEDAVCVASRVQHRPSGSAGCLPLSPGLGPRLKDSFDAGSYKCKSRACPKLCCCSPVQSVFPSSSSERKGGAKRREKVVECPREVDEASTPVVFSTKTLQRPVRFALPSPTARRKTHDPRGACCARNSCPEYGSARGTPWRTTTDHTATALARSVRGDAVRLSVEPSSAWPNPPPLTRASPLVCVEYIQ